MKTCSDFVCGSLRDPGSSCYLWRNCLTSPLELKKKNPKFYSIINLVAQEISFGLSQGKFSFPTWRRLSKQGPKVSGQVDLDPAHWLVVKWIWMYAEAWVINKKTKIHGEAMAWELGKIVMVREQIHSLYTHKE